MLAFIGLSSERPSYSLENGELRTEDHQKRIELIMSRPVADCLLSPQ